MLLFTFRRAGALYWIKVAFNNMRPSAFTVIDDSVALQQCFLSPCGKPPRGSQCPPRWNKKWWNENKDRRIMMQSGWKRRCGSKLTQHGCFSNIPAGGGHNPLHFSVTLNYSKTRMKLLVLPVDNNIQVRASLVSKQFKHMTSAKPFSCWEQKQKKRHLSRQIYGLLWTRYQLKCWMFDIFPLKAGNNPPLWLWPHAEVLLKSFCVMSHVISLYKQWWVAFVYNIIKTW